MAHSYPILATGAALPQRCVSNVALIAEHGLDSSDEWIVSRTGITQRYICSGAETTATLAAAAAQQALRNARLKPADIGVLIVATCTPAQNFPSTAALVQAALGLPHHTMVLDVNAACTGFISALATAQGLLETSAHTHALVIGAEWMTSTLDWSDRGTCILFGDGAGAVVLGKRPEARGQGQGLLGWALGADGAQGDMLCTVGGKTRMNGREVFRQAVREMGHEPALLKQHKLKLADINWLVPHQANVRIIEAAARALEVPMEKVIVTVGQHANTSGASIPLALHHANDKGLLKPGQNILLQAFGAGFTWGSALIKW